MLKKNSTGLIVLLLLSSQFAYPQQNRAQYPPFLSNSFFSINVGYIHMPFTENHPTPEFDFESISLPHTAIRINLGHQFNENWSAQISYMRPFNWTKYVHDSERGWVQSVSINLGAASVKYRTLLAKRLSVYGELGFLLISRGGFKTSRYELEDAVMANMMSGTGLHYHVHPKLDILLSFVYAPPLRKKSQPETYLVTGGFAYYFRPLPEEKVKINSKTPYIFHRNLFQIGYTTNFLGFGPNRFFSYNKGEFGIPIFWEGNIYVRDGIKASYQRNVFHSRKIFSFDWGASFSYMQSEINKEHIFAIAIYPLFRFSFVRTKRADIYFNYSVAGPAYISKSLIDNLNAGGLFTFQDFMGIGGMFGQGKHFNFEIKITHFSNGNLLPHNEGVAVPLTFNVGYAY